MFPFSNAPLKIALLLWPVHLYQLWPFIYIRNLSWSVDLQLLYYNGIEKFTKITVLTLSKLCELANYNIAARRLQYSVNIELHFFKNIAVQSPHCNIARFSSFRITLENFPATKKDRLRFPHKLRLLHWICIPSQAEIVDTIQRQNKRIL